MFITRKDIVYKDQPNNTTSVEEVAQNYTEIETKKWKNQFSHFTLQCTPSEAKPARSYKYMHVHINKIVGIQWKVGLYV